MPMQVGEGDFVVTTVPTPVKNTPAFHAFEYDGDTFTVSSLAGY